MSLGSGASKVGGARELTCTAKEVSMTALQAGTVTLNQTVEYLLACEQAPGLEERGKFIGQAPGLEECSKFIIRREAPATRCKAPKKGSLHTSLRISNVCVQILDAMR